MVLAAALLLAGCGRTGSSSTNDDESAQQIANRAAEITAAADAAVNQQIEEINAAVASQTTR